MEISSSGECLPSDYTANTSSGGCLSTSSIIGGGTGEYKANNMSSVPNLGNETSGYHPSPSKFKTAQEMMNKSQE